MIDTFIANKSYSGNIFLAPREKFNSNLPQRVTCTFCEKIKINCHLNYFSTFTFSKSSNFS